MCLIRYQNVKKLDRKESILLKYSCVKGNSYLLRISVSIMDNRIDDLTWQKIEVMKRF